MPMTVSLKKARGLYHMPKVVVFGSVLKAAERPASGHFFIGSLSVNSVSI